MRLGYAIVWGERVTTHPLASSTSWRSSLRDQAGNADNALLRAKYGRHWRSLIGTSQGRTGRHLMTTAAAMTALAAIASSRISRSRSGSHWARLAAAAGIVDGADSGVRRRPDPRWASLGTGDQHRVADEYIDTALAVAHRLRGEFRVRFAGRRDFGIRSVKPRAVLFDRDGTLIEDVPYLIDPQRVRPMPGARRTLDQLRRQGVAVGVVSNQSGVARGLIAADELEQVNARVESLLGPFDTWQVCPHAPDARCGCRKPEPGMVTAAARELGLAPDECLLIGDIGSDVDAALAAGARAVLVPTRHTKVAEIDHAHRVAAVAPNLRAAVRRHVGRS